MATLTWLAPPSDEAIFVSLRIDLEPVPKGRARAARTPTGIRTYTPQRTLNYEQEIGWLLQRAKVVRNEVDDLGVHAIFHVKGRKISDVDNLCKALLDGCNKIAWHDDKQVVRLSAEVVHDSDDPHTDFQIYVTRRRARDCVTCGKPLGRRHITAGQVYCDKICYDGEQRRNRRTRVCDTCGKEVTRVPGKDQAARTFCTPECRVAERKLCRVCGGQLKVAPSVKIPFCSTACSEAWHRGKGLAPSVKAYGTCGDCGSPTAKAGTRCRACFVKHKAIGKKKAGPTYDACPECGERKRTTAQRCMTCYRAALKARGAEGPKPRPKGPTRQTRRAATLSVEGRPE